VQRMNVASASDGPLQMGYRKQDNSHLNRFIGGEITCKGEMASLRIGQNDGSGPVKAQVQMVLRVRL
jgi:hypothetical protein